MQEIIHSPVLAPAVGFWAVGFAGTFAATMLVRAVAGVGPGELASSRCYEIPPIRGLIHVAHALLWIVQLAAPCVMVRGIHAAWNSPMDRTPGIITASIGLAVTVVVFFLRRGFRRGLVEIPPEGNAPPQVHVSCAGIRSGIPGWRLDRLGCERFPSAVSPWFTAGLWTRRAMLLIGLCGSSLLVYAALAEHSNCPVIPMVREGAQPILPMAAEIPEAALLPLLSSGIILFVIGLFGDRTYTLIRFPWMLVLYPVFAGMILAPIAARAGSPERVMLAGGGLWFAVSIRLWADLSLARRYRRVKAASDLIIDQIRAQGLPLAWMPGRADCRLEPVSPEMLSERLTRGLRNVEGAGALVTRNFGRFMRLVNVHTEHFTGASLRYMTVRRWVELTPGIGTFRAFQSPSVPAWDEQLFPLRPPEGIVTLRDPLHLDRSWDVVCLCSRCGGSGRVTRTETYTETVNGRTETRTRTVTETCPSCSGCGRLEHGQVLVTMWERLAPTQLHPPVPMPELMDDAEERVYFRLPLVENRSPADPTPQIDGLEADLLDEMMRASGSLAAAYAQHAPIVEQLHGGRVYRADFQAIGFWALNIDFTSLRGRTGWFFGKRPEFFFPLLPLSWSMLATWLTLLPLACVGLGIAARMAFLIVTGEWTG